MGKHLTDVDRTVMEQSLNNGLSLAEIANALGKSRSTVSREIRKHRQEKDTGAYGRIKNRCLLRADCQQHQLCANEPDCVRRCSTCARCNQCCPNFKEELCAKLNVPPYVCNACPDLKRCVLRKFFYLATAAHSEYRSVLSGNRQGFNMTTGEVKTVDEIVSPCIKNGQSIHHIWVNNADALPVGERTIARLIHANLLEAGVLDQKRVCKLKPRKSKPVHKIDRACRTGRTFADFRLFMAQHPEFCEVEMDSVIGEKGGKVLLTLIFPSSQLMLAFLRDANTAQSALDKIDFLYDALGHDDFTRLFSVLLTDNGSEFTNPLAFEFNGELRRSHLFYCDPMASFQKPHVERNHEFLRYILPKGSSFNNLSQMDINLVMAHINSYKRPSLGDKSPVEVFTFQYGVALADKLLHLVCHTPIPPNEIILTPKLLSTNS